jgi:hypothetical protein
MARGEEGLDCDFQFGGFRTMLRCECAAKYLRVENPGNFTAGAPGYREVEFRDWYLNVKIADGKCIVCGAELERRYRELLVRWETS